MLEAQFEAMEGRLEELTVASAQPDISTSRSPRARSFRA